MKIPEKYGIDIVKLPLGVSHFSFNWDSDFFARYPHGLVENGSLQVQVALDKSETMLVASFAITGNVELTCDRTLNLFLYPIDLKERVIYKFGDETGELADEMQVIDWNTQRIDASLPVYDFVSLAVPMKKLCPEALAAQEHDTDTEGNLLLYTTGGNKEDEGEGDEPDPRWSALLNLRSDN